MSAPRSAVQRSLKSLRPSQQCLFPQTRSFVSHAPNSTTTTTRLSPSTSSCLRPHHHHQITPTRLFSSTPNRSYKSVEEAKSKYRLGPFSWQAGLLFLLAGAGLTLYFRHEKDRMSRQRTAQHSKGVGAPLVGGPITLIDHNGHAFTEANLKGKYSLVYFGFTHCPDICPEELDKMAGMIDNVKAAHGNVLLPVFITCDPARDTPEVIKEYLQEFHGDMVGLTGEWEQVKQACKMYRVYFSTPPDVKPGQDYLVDHSIYFYLMDPEGDFVEAIGRNFTVEQASKVINDHIADWRGPINKE